MRKIKTEYIILILLFLFVLGFRSYFAFESDHFNTDSAYFHLRHIEHLVDEKTILLNDELSYGGRTVIYPPFFHILLAVLSLGSIFMLKLMPEILIGLTVFLVYLIAKEISGSTYASIFAALLSAFYPILFNETLNNISIYSLIIPLLLLMFYCLLRLDDKKYLWTFVVTSFVLPLVHPTAFIFVLTIIIYFILLAGGALTPTKLKKEAAIFTLFVSILFQFLIYKKAFLEYGANVLWQSVPANVISDSFRQLSPIDLLVGVGLLPLILGAIGIYISITRDKKKVSYMFASFAITIILLMFFRFLTISVGLMFLGMVLAIFSAVSCSTFFSYLDKFKFYHAKRIFVLIFLVLFVFASFAPSILAASESVEIAKSKIKEVRWFKFNTEPGEVILGNVGEGNLIASIGNRANVIDDNFLFAPNPIRRSEDIDIIYSSVSEAIALNLIKKYDIKVIYLSDDTMDKYGRFKLNYAEESDCFRSVRGGRYYVVEC